MKISHNVLLAALIVTAGCDGEGVTRSPPTEVAFFNAAPNVEVVSFLREETDVSETEPSLTHGAGYEGVFDSGQYDFHIEHFSLAEFGFVRSYSSSETLAADLDHIFVATAPAGVAEFFVATRPDNRQSDNNARLTLVHAFDGLGPLDVYVEAPGTDLTTAVSHGRLSFGPNPVSAEVGEGTFSLFLTTADDPTDVVFESFPFESFSPALPGGIDNFLVVSDPGGVGTLDINVSLVLQTSTIRIGQIGQSTELRVIQGVDDKLDRDIYLDETTVAPLFPGQPFGVLSDYTEISVAQHNVITTQLNNPGTEESSGNIPSSPGRSAAVVISGNTTDGVATHIVIEDKRSIAGQATFRIYNAAGLFSSVAVYIVDPGTDITTATPRVDMLSPSSSQRLPVLPGDYELWFENLNTATVLAGPVPVTVIDGGVYGILVVNGPDASTADIALFDDFIP